MFGLDFQPPAGRYQRDWRYCQRCTVLFWDGASAKGRCPLGGGHTAEGLNFHLLCRLAADDPAKAISAVIQDRIEDNRARIEGDLTAALGRGDRIANGVTLYNINFRLAAGNFRYMGSSFAYTLNDNYLYFKSTTPTALGSWGDPAFECHFDVSVTGPIVVSAQGKPLVGTVLARVTRITASPRNVSGGVVTTIVHFMQETGGREIIEMVVDKYINQKLTERLNTELQQF